MNSKKWWHRPRPAGFLNFGHQNSGTTEYIDTYKGYKMPKTESFKPTQVLKVNDEQVSDRTTFRVDYIPHPLSTFEKRPPETYKPPEKPMEGISLYRQDYPGHSTGPIQLMKRKDGRKMPSAKFDANPTYASDFKRWAIPPRVKVGPDQEYKKPEGKMESTSTFQQDFIHRYAPPREPIKPPCTAFKSDEPIDSQTLHKMHYVPHDLEVRAKREREKYNPPSIPMHSITTMQTDFKGRRAPPAESMKPTHTFMQSTDPLATSSEFRDRFVAWPVHRPERREALKYKAPEGTMDLQSTQRLDFKLLNGRPALPVKPVVRLAQSHPFDGTTNYSNDFKRWNYQKVLVKPKEEWVPGDEKFDGLSTTRQHYVSYPGNHAAKSFKPLKSALQSDKPLDDQTLYKINYVPQSMENVERYPTPNWLKHQETMWQQHRNMLAHNASQSLDPSARAVNVAA